MSGYPCGHLQRTMVNFKRGPQVRANRGAMSGRANPVKAIILVSALWFVTALALADDSYFPIKTKAGGEGVTAFESKWYGKSLERMNEPRLPGFVKDVNADIYRIMILPTWGNSIVVRVQRRGRIIQPVSSPTKRVRRI
jgi:hypothetical protein